VALSHDGQSLAAGGTNGIVVTCLGFSPDGQHIATGNNNGTVYLFSLTAPDGMAEPH
jgi:WD40 repeat protein